MLETTILVVDRTLNEWSEWQLKNLNAIVWLYRGETEKYTALLNEYRAVLGNGSFEDVLHQLKDELKDLQKRAKIKVEKAGRNDKKRIQAEYDKMIVEKNEEITVAKRCGTPTTTSSYRISVKDIENYYF